MIPDIPLPSQDASTFAGQMEWFLAGFGYASVIASVALMIVIFRKSTSGGTHEN